MLRELLQKRRSERALVFSIEIFPPKTEQGVRNLKERLHEFKRFRPDFVSVTYGAGGSTRQGTLDFARYVQTDVALPSMAHLTCMGQTRSDVQAQVDALNQAGIRNIMALRGDMPQDETGGHLGTDGFRYANELITYLKSRGGFSIGCAGYPEGHVEAHSEDADFDRLRSKIDAGADFIASQFFLDNDYFFRFRDKLVRRRVHVPLLAGILPISNFSQISKFSILCGCTIPARVMRGLHGKSDIDQEKFGLEHAARQIEELVREGVDGVHLYALNKRSAVEALAPVVRQIS